jgi:hypothetical protein
MPAHSENRSHWSSRTVLKRANPFACLVEFHEEHCDVALADDCPAPSLGVAPPSAASTARCSTAGNRM